MNENRFNEIEALAINEVEVFEYFKLKKQNYYLKKYKKFPLKILYNSGVVTDEILINDSPVAIKLKDTFFMLGVFRINFSDLFIFEGGQVQIKNIDYVLSLPDKEDALLLKKNIFDFRLCEEIYYKMFADDMKYLGLSKIFVKDNGSLFFL